MTAQSIPENSTTALKACSFEKRGWTFDGWAATEDGIAEYADQDDFSILFEDVTLYARWTAPAVYSPGDRGPAGGWVIYDKGVYSDGWRYLEAGPVDLTSRIWGTIHRIIPGADGTAVGTGAQNTADIRADDPMANKAADECDGYSLEAYGLTFDNWHLPSYDELDLMYDNLKVQGLGGFDTSSSGWYWSSTENSDYRGDAQRFDTGLQSGNGKSSSYKSRPVRPF